MRELSGFHAVRRPVLPILAAGCLLWPGTAAALFSDDEARKAILDLRARVEANRGQAESADTRLADENAVLRRSLLDLQNQIEAVKADLARQRGANEQLAREIAEGQRRERDGAQGAVQRVQAVDERMRSLDDRLKVIDERLRSLEPLKVQADGRELLVSAAEKRDFDVAFAAFRAGDFAAAQSGLQNFLRRHPASAYQPSVHFWLGNAQYAQKDFKDALASFRAMLADAGDHPRVPDALLSVANCQIELKDIRGARKTLEDLVRLHPKSEAATAARERLPKLR